MNTFGREDGNPKPPACLFSICVNDEHKAEKLLSYAVPLEGVVSVVKELHIIRFLDTAGSVTIIVCMAIKCFLFFTTQILVGQTNSLVLHLILHVSA